MKKDEIRERIVRGIQATADKLKETAKVSQLKAKVFSLRRKMNSDFTELGERLYTLVKTGKMEKPDDVYIGNLLDSLESLESEINQLEEEIIKVKAEEVLESEEEGEKEE